ncbi:MAG: cellulase family glycosylhydrolase [Bacteroidetes bacterium]|nr:cellulase family glycosylhydrolase [Bacteroidota bacterium]
MKTKIILSVLLIITFGSKLSSQIPTGSNYITLDCNTFMDDNEVYYPMVVNYNVSIGRNGSGNFFITPRYTYHPDYDATTNPTPYGNTMTDGIAEIRKHFAAVREMGFNTIRLTGLSARSFSSSTVSFWGITAYDLTNTFTKDEIAPMVQQILLAASDFGLRVILLTGGGDSQANSAVTGIQTQSNKYMTFLDALANELKDYTALMAYDFYNEPIYEDEGNYTKSETKKFVEDWYNTIKNVAPNHLTTIGLVGFTDVVEWDPGLMKVDFLSFHSYPDLEESNPSLDKIRTHLYWMKNAVDAPWIIGETGYTTSSSGTGVNGTYSQLAGFASTSLEDVRNCYSSGYSWWTFQDQSGDGHGLLNNDQTTFQATYNTVPYTINGNYKTAYTNLPFANFLNPNVNGSPYNNGTCCQPCSQPSSYYDYYGNNLGGNNWASGTVLDKFGQPINNAIIYIENPNGSKYMSFSRADGTFDVATAWSNVFTLGLTMKIVATKCIEEHIILDIGSYPSKNVGNVILTYIETNEGNISLSSGTTEYTDLAEQVLDNVTLNNGSSTKFIAEKRIHLLPGVKAYNGAISHLYIDDLHCPTNSNSNYSGVMPLQRLSDVNEPTTILVEDNNVKVYPNPNKGDFAIELSGNIEENHSIAIYNLQGQEIYNKDIFIGINNIDLSNEPKGIYFIKITSGTNITFEKIIKN